MDRRVLARGKRLSDGSWVEGYYCRVGPCRRERPFIIPDYASALYGLEVDPSTVGQYTGLADKNGVWIFEGDILEIHFRGSETTALVQFGNRYRPYGFILQYPGTAWDDLALLDQRRVICCKVIGNIHDSPGLWDR